MKRQVALIRGINVGRAKRVPMAELREALTERGFENVRTLLNSGNVVFDADGSARSNASTVQEVIEERFGVTARVLGLATSELATVVDENPLAGIADDPSRLMVVVAFDPDRLSALEPLAEREWGSEQLAVGSRAAYLWCPAGILASEANEAVGRALGDGATTRNWRTTLKLQALAEREP
ncbi:MAG TPA: DUF1697 domain-containing protein [Thermoanaerobaculia bacterium]|nr:DUF1697 domain-containing protein [Thermoanaerobaculia bacterium]